MSTTVKYVPTNVELKTQADCWKALLDGYVLRAYPDIKLKLVDGYVFNLTVGVRDVEWSFKNFLNWEPLLEVEIPWYETANFPVLCWAGTGKDYVVLIESYEVTEHFVYFLSSTDTKWVACTPVSLEEFQSMNGQFNGTE